MPNRGIEVFVVHPISLAKRSKSAVGAKLWKFHVTFNRTHHNGVQVIR
jgi:hypothetical protein